MKSRVAKTLGLVAALAACVGMTVFAAPSPSASTPVTGASAVDASGNTVEVSMTEVPADVAASIQSEETLRVVLGDDFNENIVVADVMEVSVPEGTAFPIDITFEVPGVTSSTTAYVLHYVDGAWQTEPTTVGEGTVTGTFESLSPVAIALDKTTLSSGAGATSPKTSASTVSVVAVIGLAAAAAAFGMKKSLVK